MTEDAHNGAQPVLSDPSGAIPQHESSASFSTSREEYIVGDNDNDDLETYESSLEQLNDYPEDVDYYAVLGLPRNPPPSDMQIRSAFRLLSPNFHPDKHPQAQQEATETFEKLENAYEVLIDPHKRAVYDLLGREGVQREWDPHSGAMGMYGPNQDQMVGIRAMDVKEFKTWFLEKMRKQERQLLESMVENRTHVTLGLTAISVFPAKEDGILAYSIAKPHVKPSSYHVRSSFKLPLPRSANAELRINAGIGGPLSRLRKEIEYELESGEKETKSFLMPISIFTRSITLGMNGSFTVPGSGRKSILKLFRGCEVEAGAALFPKPVLRTSVFRSLTPLKGAQPLRLSVQTTYDENVVRMPPIVDISLSRRLGSRQFANIGWSSGMWFWPSFLETALGPFLQLGIRGDDIISMTNYSSCRIGFTSYPAPAISSDQSSGDSATESDGTDHVSPSKLSPLSEAWGFELTSSPFGGAMSVNYGRNLFRGQIRTPLRSEWSDVGYHKNHCPPVSRPQAVRLDLQGSLSLDGTIGWMVQGSRGIGEFSRLGLGVGVQGPRGLVVSITYSRLGQSMNLPIVICPLNLVNIDLIAASVAIPWTFYAAIHYGVILPRTRWQHKEVLKKRRRELEALVQARRTACKRDIELMAGRVRRRQAVELENHGLVIIEARYGATGQTNSNASTTPSKRETGTVIDVTIPVAALIHQGQLAIARGVNKSQIVGFYDPVPLKPKELQVRYLFGGREHFVKVRDDEAVSCPRESHRVCDLKPVGNPTTNWL